MRLLFGKRKDGQSYVKRNKSSLKKVGSTKSSGKVLPAKPSLLKNPLNTTKWSVAFDRYETFKNNTKLHAFSFDPQDRKGYDFTDKNHTIRFHYKFDYPTLTGEPIYLVSLTNQVGNQLTRELHSNYLHAKNLGYSPLIGHWKGEGGQDYTDITIAMNSTTRQEAMKLAKNHQQEGIIAIYNNGDFEYIPT